MKDGKFLDYCPTAKDIIAIATHYLNAEILNDAFFFANPVRGHHRPAEAQGKATAIIEAIENLFSSPKREIP